MNRRTTLDCYIIPAKPLNMLLPVACIAEILADPAIEPLSNAKANWTEGHVTWRNQRLPVLNYSALLEQKIDESEKAKPRLVVLNPIPNAARKAYAGLLCYGDVQRILIQANIEFSEAPKSLDKRYLDGVVAIDEQQFIVPKLAALGVAFSYF